MDIATLISKGNICREENCPEEALKFYAQAFTEDRNNPSAFNNYGNVLRELGEPESALPFLQRAVQLAPNSSVANFNLAVCYLLLGDYTRGWQQYESRWNYEHLDGTLPKYSQPRWTGQDLKDKTILIWTEQGLGDTIQFARFLFHIHNLGAKIVLQVNNNLAPLFAQSPIIHQIVDSADTPTDFDYWIPMMSIANAIGLTLENLPNQLSYMSAHPVLVKEWGTRLGPKSKLRVGFCWSGRPDSWINRHKGMPFETMKKFVEAHPEYEWINLQVECSPEQSAELETIGVKNWPGAIRNFADTSALMSHLDVVITVDTSVAHLAGALGRPTWIMLPWFGVDWRWLTNREDSPWYPSARLYRQPKLGDWDSVFQKIEKFLALFKI
jgi:hypothetical protein